MEFRSSSILADADIAKVVFGVIAVIIWGIGSLASMVKKANEEARRRALLRPQAPAAPSGPADQRMVVGGFAGSPVPRPPPLPSSMLQRAKAAGKKRQPIKPAPRVIAPQARAAPPKPQAAAASTRPVVEKVSSIAQTNVARTNLAGAKAPAIRKWLVPATLRKQFILTELLRPPVALREGVN